MLARFYLHSSAFLTSNLVPGVLRTRSSPNLDELFYKYQELGNLPEILLLHIFRRHICTRHKSILAYSEKIHPSLSANHNLKITILAYSSLYTVGLKN